MSSIDFESLLAYHALYIDLSQLQQIEHIFGSWSAGLAASDAQWQAADILRPAQLSKWLGAARSEALRARDVAWEWGQVSGQSWMSWWSDTYPEALKTIDQPPPILGVRGDADWLKQPQLAVVGSRHASKAGMQIAEDFAKFLSQQGMTITSGLAQGIDAAAHTGGLDGQGKTVAVVATGLDRIYPAANQYLGRRVAEEGVMISEFPLYSRPLQFHFPQRNRIISGLSYGTLVVEAALKSGSLITARLAMEQGREVFAVPGSIHNPQSKGCHQLIKQGAKLVESGQDIFEELLNVLPFDLQALQPAGETVQSRKSSGQSSGSPLNSTSHSKLLNWIEFEPISLDELAVLSKMPVSQIQADLLLLELSGAIEKLSAGRWRRLR